MVGMAWETSLAVRVWWWCSVPTLRATISAKGSSL